MGAMTASGPERHAGRERIRTLAIPILASWAILLASLVNFLRFNDYPLLRPEIALIAFGLLALAALFGWIHSAQRPLGQAALDMLLVLLVVDQNGASFAFAAATAALVGAVTLYRRRSVLPLLGLVAAFALLSGLAGIGQQHSAAAETRRVVPPRSAGKPLPPALVHIVLDEQLGIEAFSDLGPEGQVVQRELKAFYLSHGFRLYGRAYAEQFRTVNSIPQILNFGAVARPDANPFNGRALERNAYFDALAKDGYRLDVYQSDFIDYCDNRAVSRCVTYPFSALDAIDRSPLSVADRAVLIVARFALLSKAVFNLESLYIEAADSLRGKGYDVPDFGLTTGGRTSSLAASAAFDRLIGDLRNAKPGHAYFAHILLPHDPYALDSRCTPRPMWQWQVHDPSPPLAMRQAAYLDQVRCALRKVDAAYAAVSRSQAGRDFIMVVHGDHGSRITSVNPTAENIGKYGRDDLVAGFATLFAIRAPRIAAGYDDRPAAVPRLLAGLARSRFTSAPLPSTAAPHVILNDRNWAPRKRAPFLRSW